MAGFDRAALERALDQVPQRFKGPGGVAGVVKDGHVIARRAWGYRDSTARLPMDAGVRHPICSITKQFTCGVLLDQIGDPAVLDARVAEYLPEYVEALPTAKQLCDNQSGLRDYWALTVLHGAVPEAEFRRKDGLALLMRMKTGHFAPGAAYSYCNCNFRILAELIEAQTGRDMAELYATSIFAKAGMTTAVLSPDTRSPVDGLVGYEGNDDIGFLPAQNGITWIGDAGISASLDDMLAWEVYIDATRDDPDGLYNRLSVPPLYGDGTPAHYGYGLRHEVIAGAAVTGHGGGLRGFRSNRIHAASERLSVVVMFNHEANAHAATSWLMETALGHDVKPQGIAPRGWDGLWLDEAQGLAVRVAQDATGLTLRYATGPARLTVADDGVARGPGVTLNRAPVGMTMQRTTENLTLTARPVSAAGPDDSAPVGRYWSDELEATLVVDARDGGCFAGFDGMLGAGPMERMYPLGKDLWVITTRRSMDAAPPGDWTVQVHRDGQGAVVGLTVGCWLARRISYRRV
ncbi:MAG: D-aminopeptidase [Gemmobacter sp.]|nr:D-aminopeptidase [Gemmobacter sp.]